MWKKLFNTIKLFIYCIYHESFYLYHVCCVFNKTHTEMMSLLFLLWSFCRWVRINQCNFTISAISQCFTAQRRKSGDWMTNFSFTRYDRWRTFCCISPFRMSNGFWVHEANCAKAAACVAFYGEMLRPLFHYTRLITIICNSHI